MSEVSKIDVGGKTYEFKDETARKDLETKADKDQVASPFNFKGNVTSVDKLPTSDNAVNDTYYVVDVKAKYSWTGTAWEQSSLSELEYEQEISGIKNIIYDFIGTVDIMFKAEILEDTYIGEDKNLMSSTMWNAYKIKLSEAVIRSIKLYSNSDKFYAIAFYSSSDICASNFISGIKFSNFSETGEYILENVEIPMNAKYAILSNRRGTGTSVSIRGFLVNGNIADAGETITEIEETVCVDITTFKSITKYNYYIGSNKSIIKSDYWTSYVLDASLIRRIREWRCYTNSSDLYAIAFYNSYEISEESFISGVKFITNDSDENVFNDVRIPSNTVAIVCSTRTATNEGEVLKCNVKCILQDVHNRLADTAKIVDYISNSREIDYIKRYGAIGNYYVDRLGKLHSSLYWSLYDIPLSFTSLSVKSITNDVSLLAIAFYSSKDATSDTLIKGISYKENNVFNEFSLDFSDIPDGTKRILIASRTASSNKQEVLGIELVNNSVENIDKSLDVINNRLSELGGIGNIRAIYKNIPNTNDFTVVKDEIWFAQNQYVDGVATDTTYIYRYKIKNGILIKISEIKTDFGHWNCVDYCEENDCLIFGNGANNSSTEGNWFAVIPHPLKLSDTASIDADGLRFNVDIGFKVQAVWGDNNLGKYNIAYLLSNNATTITVVMLLRDENSEFNGEFIILETINSNTNIGIGGADFYGNTLYIGNGERYRLDLMNMTDYSIKEIEKKYYYTDGTRYDGSTQGIHVDSDYLWVFSNVGGKSENYLIQYYR